MSDTPVDEPDAVSEQAPDDAETRRRPRVRVAWGRGAVGTLVSLVGVGAVVVGAFLPWPMIGGEAASVEVEPDPSASSLVCEGPLLAVGLDATSPDAVTAAAETDVTIATGSDAEPSVEPIAHPGVSGDQQPERYLTGPGGVEPLAVAASADIRSDDVAGFAASACRAASMESWLVGGDVTVGASGVLMLANPGEANATVQLTVYGTDAPVVPPAAEGIAVPAGTQLALPLAGVAGGEESPVIRVTATGAPVRATLESSVVRTLDPVGVDRQGAVTAAERQVFPGAKVTEEAEGSDNSPLQLRLLSESEGSATITVVEQGETGQAIDPVTVPLRKESPVSIDVGDLPAGSYDIIVESDRPVVAAAWQTTGFGDEADFAWQTPSPALGGKVLVAVPDGPDPRLSLHNDGTAPATVVVTGEDGEEREVDLGDGESMGIEAEPGTAYTIDPGEAPDASVRASIGYLGDAAIATVPVLPDPAAPDPITVYP